MNKICNSIHDSCYTNCRQAASAYKVWFWWLQRLWNRSALKNTQASTHKTLTKRLDAVICKYIDRLGKMNIRTYPLMILGAANDHIYFESHLVSD